MSTCDKKQTLRLSSISPCYLCLLRCKGRFFVPIKMHFSTICEPWSSPYITFLQSILPPNILSHPLCFPTYCTHVQLFSAFHAFYIFVTADCPSLSFSVLYQRLLTLSWSVRQRWLGVKRNMTYHKPWIAKLVWKWKKRCLWSGKFGCDIDKIYTKKNLDMWHTQYCTFIATLMLTVKYCT